MPKQIITTIRLPAEDYQQIKKLVNQGKYLNLADFVRKAVKKQLENEEAGS